MKINQPKLFLTAVILTLCTIAGFSGILNQKHRFVHVSQSNLENLAINLSGSLTKLSSLTEANAKSLGGGLIPNVINLLRNSIGTVIGYSSTENYLNMVCGGDASTCEGPPKEGIIGAVTGVVNELKTIGANAGINSCDDVPTSGTATGTNSAGTSVTVTFETPTHSIPSTWSDGGVAYTKRVRFDTHVALPGATQPLAVVYEFICGTNSAYAALSMGGVGDASTTSWTRDITIYQGKVDNTGTNAFQVYMAEQDRGNATALRSAYAIDIHYNDSTKLFNAWGVLTGTFDGTELQAGTGSQCASGCSGANVLMKVNLAGNYSTGKTLASVRAVSQQGGTNDGSFDATVYGSGANASAVGATNAGLESGSDGYDMSTHITADSVLYGSSHHGLSQGSPGARDLKACIDLSAATSVDPSSSDCSGFTLIAPPEAPAVDSNGDWSLNWALNTMRNKLELFTVPNN